MEKERLHYIDVAKGILILLVAYGHIYGLSKNACVDDISIEWIHRSINLFVSFYMPCFFVVTGFCSSFKKPFFTILVQSLKSIVLPGVFFTMVLMVRNLNYDSMLQLLKSIVLYGGAYWFLSSLFLARIFYWIVFNKIEKKIFRMLYVSLLLQSVLLLIDYTKGRNRGILFMLCFLCRFFILVSY